MKHFSEMLLRVILVCEALFPQRISLSPVVSLHNCPRFNLDFLLYETAVRFSTFIITLSICYGKGRLLVASNCEIIPSRTAKAFKYVDIP